jgi:WD40 repeat protein
MSTLFPFTFCLLPLVLVLTILCGGILQAANMDDSAPSEQSPAPAPRRRWRLRFSLLSLLCFVLLAGSSMGLWFRWEPWVACRMPSRQEKGIPGIPSILDVCEFSADSRYLACSDDGRRVLILDAASATTVRRIGNSDTFLRDFGFSGDSSLAILGFDDRIELWSVAHAQLQLTVNLTSFPEGARPPLLRLPKGGDHLLGTNGVGTLHVWSAENGQHLFDVGPAQGSIASDAESVAQRNHMRKQAAACQDLREFVRCCSQGAIFVAARLSENGATIMTEMQHPESDSLPGLVHFWDGAGLRLRASCALERDAANGDEVLVDGSRLSSDGRYLALHDSLRLTRVVATDTGQTRTRLDLTDYTWFRLTGEALAVYRVREDVPGSDLFAWDLRTGRTLERVSGFVYTALPAPSGNRYAISDAAGTAIVDPATGVKLFMLRRSNAYDARTPVAFSPDGSKLLTACSGHTLVYSRRRPEYWWGLAWLPEFWIAHVSAAALAWSLRRDWRTLRAPRPT